MKLKRPIFEAKKGWWGEHGWVRVSFWKYLTLVEEYVTRIRWIKMRGE